MTINLLTLFADYFKSPFSMGIIGNSIDHGLIKINTFDLRKYGLGNYRKCDDYPYGGGPGLIMTTNIFDGYYKEYPKKKNDYTVLLSPTGKLFNQAKARELSKKKRLSFILGHYEGIDARVETLYADETISIGDYVVSGAESAVIVIIDAICRYKGALGNDDSLINDTFEENANGLLEYEQYTRPKSINNLCVPDILQGGNHREIMEFRRKQSLLRTFRFREDLFAKATLTKNDIKTIYNYLVEKSYD